MTSNFANHSDRSVAKHLPDAFHGGEIPVELTFEPGVPVVTAASVIGMPMTVSPFRAIALNGGVSLESTFRDSAIDRSTARHGSRRNDNPSMTTVRSTFDPWSLLRNSDLGCQRAIRLVVHGRSLHRWPVVLALEGADSDATDEIRSEAHLARARRRSVACGTRGCRSTRCSRASCSAPAGKCAALCAAAAGAGARASGTFRKAGQQIAVCQHNDKL